MSHLSEDQIERLLTQGASVADASASMSHIMGGCLHCLVVAESVLTRTNAKGAAAALLERYLDLQQENVVDLLLAEAQWGEMKSLGGKVQKEKVAKTSICKSASFVRLLMEELKATSSWEEAERLAGLVSAAVNAMNPAEYPTSFKNDIRGEVLIELANSRRRAAEWKRAFEALRQAGSFLRAGSQSRMLEGRRLSVSASLEADTGQLDKAIADLETARSLYEELQQPQLVARTLLQAANSLSEHDPRKGLVFLDEADSRFPPGDALTLNARVCRVECLVGTGQTREAVFYLSDCERPIGRMQTRYRFIGARLLHALGYRKEAERIFQAVVTEDLERELYKDALLDLLFLLKVHIVDGESGKALAVCHRALNDALLSDFSHDQLKEVWGQVLSAIEGKRFVPDSVRPLRKYVSLHWKHPAPQPPSFILAA